MVSTETHHKAAGTTQNPQSARNAAPIASSAAVTSKTASSKISSIPVASKFFFIGPVIIQTIVITFSKVLFAVFFHYTIKGREHLKELPSGVIFAANHISELDPVVVPVSLSYFSRFIPMYYVSREKNFYVHSGWRGAVYGGTLFKLCGAYQAYTGLGDYELSLRNHIAILNADRNVCIFPEGKRSRDGKMGDPKGGVGYLAHRTQKPVVPVFISGIARMTLKDFLLRKRKLTVIFGKPIYPHELFPETPTHTFSPETDPHKQAAKRIMDQIALLQINHL